MSHRNRLLGSLSATLVFLFAAIGLGISQAQTDAPAVDVLQINLDTLIDAAAGDRNRFAVDIPYAIDTSRVGTWSVLAGIATWRYSVRVPSAVSLSFHATNTFLPSSAQLSVRGGGNTYIYRAADTKKRQLWSRISKGDSLDLELTVAPQERRVVVLQITSLQAGYRGFGHAVPDHPRYARLKAQATAGSTSSCIVNYECDIAPANTPAGQATVALVIGNAYQCSGTLINDVPQDGKPYILTARHCENGKLGGGSPGAASNVVVYWDATSPCGSPLGTLYDPGIPTQQGAVTVAEQQDAWLLLLNEGPVVNDAYLAGFDATGGTIQGGYTVHHALSNNKQFTAWNGQAVADTAPASSLPVTYVSNFWNVVNRTGTIGPGASGSALFDQNNRVVGSLSLESTVGESADGYAQCPASPPPNPTTQNALAFFTSLHAVWSSTADPTSSTPEIKQALDPNNTGTLIVNSIPAPVAVRLTASQLAVSVGLETTLTWSAQGASSCTASGGNPGDGWAGSLTSNGSQQVRETAAGDVTFSIKCTYPDGHSSTSQVKVTWVPPDPVANLFAPAEAWAGGSWPLTWSTNAPPCQLTGGSAARTLTGTYGTISVTESVPGKYAYHITCGNGTQTANEDAYITIVSPSVNFYPNTTDLRLGQALELQWFSLANSCTTGGGTANDGWSGAQLGGGGFVSLWPAAVGSYTYTVNCAQGAASAQAAVTVIVENNPPYATLSVSSTQIAVGQSVTASYKSNITGCIHGQKLLGNLAQGIFETSSTGGQSEGTTTYVGGNVGASQLTLDCGAMGSNPVIVSAAPLTVTVVAAVSPSISAPASATTGTPFTLSWQTSDASSCSASGGGADGSQWTGSMAIPSGQQSITPTVTGTFTYILTCVGQVPTDTKTVQATVNVTAPPSSSASPPPTGSSAGGSNGGGGSGSGGGGAFDGLTLGMLTLAGMLGGCRSRRINSAVNPRYSDEDRQSAEIVNTDSVAGSPLPNPGQLPFVAPCRHLGALTPFEWLRLGWKDTCAAPRQSLLYGLLFASFGIVLAALTWRLGLLALYVGFASGFVFVGPFLAMGLYSISYQLEFGRDPTLLFSLQEGRAHVRETLVLGVCLLVVLLVWGRAAMIVSVFLPNDAVPTWQALTPYLGIGTLVGACFCAIVFAATAFSLPMLLDRRTDAITAVVTSINATLRNKLAMLVWGLIIAVAVLIGFATMFLGFIVLIPLLGHATWHAYRGTIDATLWPATHT